MTNNALWYIARGAGLSALVTLTLAIVLGALASIHTRAAARRVIMQYLHRTAAVLGLLLIALHVAAILLDSIAHVGAVGAFVPFTSPYRHNAVALGTTALYALLIVTALGLARGRMAVIPRRGRDLARDPLPVLSRLGGRRRARPVGRHRPRPAVGRSPQWPLHRRRHRGRGHSSQCPRR